MFKLVSYFYKCTECAHKISLDKINCAGCEQTGLFSYKKHRGYPLICDGCRRETVYFSCPKCESRIYHTLIQQDFKGLIAGIAAVVVLLTVVLVKLN